MLEHDLVYELPEGVEADYAVGVDNAECEPYIKRGGVALIRRGGEVYDGDVGMFICSRGIFIRQYCEDWAGNAHLLTLNRALRSRDILIPASEKPAVCFCGHVLGLGEIPLPER